VTGITLIRIPDRRVLAHKDVRSCIRAELEDLYDLPPTTDLLTDKLFMERVQGARVRDKYSDEARELVSAKDGELLTETCPNRTWPLHVRCSHGHEYETNYDSLERGHGCPHCAPNAPLGDSVGETVAARGYLLLKNESRKVKEGRYRRYITIKCPVADHEPVELQWDNFIKPGRYGCDECGHIAGGATKKCGKESRGGRLAVLGFTCESEHPSLTADAIYVCSHGHRFTTSLKKLEMVEADRRCPLCVVGNYDNIVLLSEYGPGTNPVRTPLTWRCRQCEAQWECTYRGMQIRKTACRNCPPGA